MSFLLCSSWYIYPFRKHIWLPSFNKAFYRLSLSKMRQFMKTVRLLRVLGRSHRKTSVVGDEYLELAGPDKLGVI